MDDYLDNSKNNIFDIDNFDNIYLSNLTYSNGFKQLFPKKNQNNFYIKKRINKNIRNRNRNNSSHIEQPETMITEKNYYPSDITENSLGIETIPIFNVKLSQSNEKNQKGKLDNKQKISLNKKVVKNLLNKRINKNKKINENISNSSIDEINISLKKLNINDSNFKVKGNISINNIKNSSLNYKKYNSIKNKIIKNKNSSISINENNEAKTKLNNKTKSKTKKVTFNDKNKQKFNNLIIKNGIRFCYINNSNESNKKIIFLKKIIYSQNINIKSLREQNQKLIEKIQKMHEENQNILELINTLKSEIIISNAMDKNENLKEENYKNHTKSMLKKSYTYPNENNNRIKLKENILNSNKIIYSLYDKNNLLSFNFSNNEFKLNPISNEDFQNNFNKEINTLFLFNNMKNILYSIVGINNDQLFIYNIKLNKMEKYSKLKNNHMFGNLLLLSNNKFSEKEQIICLSGKFNKKVEIYNDESNSWNDKIIEEMPEERCNSSYLILNNNYIYGFYGYNYILNKYLNDIVFYDLNINKWNKILNNSLDNELKGIQNHFCYENKKDKLIYILGGNNNYNQIVIDLEKESIIKMDIDKNGDEKNEGNNTFNFKSNFPYFIENNYLALFDKNYNIHIINFFSNEREFIQYK